MEYSSIHQRKPPLEGNIPFSARDRAPDSPIPMQTAVAHELTNNSLTSAPSSSSSSLSSSLSPPETIFSQYLLPYQFLCFFFPIALVLGSLFGTIGGDRPSYFSNKRNLLNVLFVKNGWGWTSVVFLIYLAVVFGKAVFRQEQSQSNNASGLDQVEGNVLRPQEQDFVNAGLSISAFQNVQVDQEPQSMVGTNLPPRGSIESAQIPVNTFAKALFRWGLATLYWWLISQWFFGPGLFDRFFVLTGGTCSVDGHWSQYNCRRQGGHWSGGIDISGHMFLLSHACLFLMEELSVFLNVPEAWTALRNRTSAKYAVWSVIGLCSLWCWMLLMTSVYYHHLMEKTTGLFFGMLFWFCTYVTTYKVLPFPGMPDQAVIL
ncbi:hypothetical protein BX616_007086 [Lobosporangium transversale]|uniref:Inositol phospholipid synthesis and fat-storage-inducing TM-domain-containing protein n=1 Tax=Lobosporangium transversale TaxID=64571 RepID=A0A1Y2GDI8_9FUNG|nr:inositol phospholipid synthesis and fat-storage-inducing TM-domain-containing protein [Lobosporangium transversale]KAF9915024.1 hypothetical protein BX616_007086 [Lobosporangium transversale]ORZ06812.1 inositol phospholipid synthesis and fat-storage-inducing TM-domain-containing protein [Lobosporangium transversale]|eukprot:XP_021877733.1 inositol phospholipid synthesis and fat-storage-inducing TM-domain-containing protein [Lobosporangium transversale]